MKRQTISITNPRFLYVVSSGMAWEWLSPSKITMQQPDVFDRNSESWLHLNAVQLYHLAKKSPNTIVHIQLLSGKHSCSRCKVKNLKIRAWPL